MLDVYQKVETLTAGREGCYCNEYKCFSQHGQSDRMRPLHLQFVQLRLGRCFRQLQYYLPWLHGDE